MDWIWKNLYEKNHTIDQKDWDLYHLVDTADEAYEYIKRLPEHLFN
jgi:hypothetical protein